MKLNKLQYQKCVACSGNTPKLNSNEIQEHLKNISGWSINEQNEMIYKKFIFKNFYQALNFANVIGKIADKESHHPDLSIGWGYCLVLIHTHAIKGLSLNDFILASKIDLLSN